MQKHIEKCVVQSGGECNEVKKRSGVKVFYRVGDNERFIKWHSSPSSSKVVKYRTSDLNRLSRELGIEKEWNDYKNKNSISFTGSLIGDLFK